MLGAQLLLCLSEPPLDDSRIRLHSVCRPAYIGYWYFHRFEGELRHREVGYCVLGLDGHILGPTA